MTWIIGSYVRHLTDLQRGIRIPQRARSSRDLRMCFRNISAGNVNLVIGSRVRKLNLGWCFLASTVAFSWPSVDRFGKIGPGLMTLGQVKSVSNFCSFSPQRAEWGKNANLNYISGLWERSFTCGILWRMFQCRFCSKLMRNDCVRMVATRKLTIYP